MRKAILVCLVGGIASWLWTLPGNGVLGAGAAETHKVIIRDFSFAPAKLTVKVGDTVEFVNEDGLPHTATKEGAGGFDTQTLSPRQGAKITFQKAGVFNYGCSIHPSMQAVIEVKE